MYYPKSQITTNLYSNGEFIYAQTKKAYTGYYWKNSSGRYFTGKNPQDTPTNELIPVSLSTISSTNPIAEFNQVKTLIYSEDGMGAPSNIAVSTLFDQTINNSYGDLVNESLNKINLPYFSLTLPTNQNYQSGTFIRYFCKKSNEILYLEINLDTYNRLTQKDPNIFYQLYQPFYINWQLTGDNETQVYNINKNIVELTMKKLKLPQFDKYLKEDYTKYYSSKTTTLEGRVVTNFTNPTALEGRVVTNRGRANNTDSSM